MFIDFDNIEIGVKNTLDATFDAGLVLEALKERGDVVSKTAYSDWQRAGSHSRMLTQHAIKMVQRNLTPGGDKNGADINLALDALEMAFTHPHINAFVIVGGDSDFISLVEKLKQYDKKVFIVGGRQFTSGILQRNCNEFIAYENLIGAPAATGRRQGGGRQVRVDRAPVEQAIPLVRRALEVLTEREVSPQLGLLKSTLLQLDSTFSERNYGAGSFRDFVDKLAHAGVVRMRQGKGGWLVEPADGAVPQEEPAAAMPADRIAVEPARAPRATAAEPRAATQAPAATATAGPPVTRGTVADGLREFRRVLAEAQVRRWPMYLRNVKQLLRQASLDERAFGFGSLVDLLRAAQKENIVRVERDRHGVVRVFQGTADSSAPPAASVPVVEGVEEIEPIIDVPVEVIPPAVDAEVVQAEPAEAVAEEPPAAPAKPARSRRSRPKRDTAAAAAPAAGSTPAPRRRRRAQA
jgi:uncharacterized LabA/DUF88 family protein